MNNKFFVLDKVYYVPSFRKNIVCVSKFFEHGYNLNFNNDIEVLKNNKVICHAMLINNLCYLKRIIPQAFNTSVDTDTQRDSKRRKIDTSDLTYKWHLRLRHIRLDRIKRLAKDGRLQSIEVDFMPTCESCLEGKMTK